MNHRAYTKRNLRKSFLESFFSNLSITGWLILVNVIFFVIVLFFVAFNHEFFDFIALKPSYILQGKYLWTLITHMFMHAPGSAFLPFLSFHLFVNMFVLFSLGSLMERVIGRKRFLWFYFISGIIAGLASVFLSGFFGYGLGEKIFGSPNISAIGASGAIFAIAGLFVILLPKIRFSIIFFPFFSLPGYIMIPLVLFLTWIASFYANLPIGNSAHFGGFLAGLVYGTYLRAKYRRKVVMLNRMIR